MISDKSINFLVAQEDGPQAYYERTEEHFDWPGGDSGATVAVGYDLGYVTRSELWADWDGILPQSAIAICSDAVGLRGEEAHRWVQQHHDDITVPWALALGEFVQREVPKWEQRCVAAIPNFELLPPDCQGSILSISYNRGTGGYTSGLPRFREMAQIRAAMAAKRFAVIPALIMSMIRIWPNSADLRHRRALEAQMFAQGLDAWVTQEAPPVPPVVPPVPPVPPVPGAGA